jgi:mono/diheme cytochrome c family protein
MLTSRAAVATTLASGALLLAVSVGASSLPQPQTPTIKKVPFHDIGSVDGRANYVAFCGACHGLSGHGDGPAVPALKVPVPDLTMMAARRGGKFDVMAIERVISGVDKMPAAHGSVDMPMWGPVFRSGGGDNTATLRLQNLVKYLQTIQKT